jgi:hypothetical protein
MLVMLPLSTTYHARSETTVCSSTKMFEHDTEQQAEYCAINGSDACPLQGAQSYDDVLITFYESKDAKADDGEGTMSLA